MSLGRLNIAYLPSIFCGKSTPLRLKGRKAFSHWKKSIKSNVYLDKKVVETKETTLNEPDMTIIDLSKYNYKDLSFEYFDSDGNKIDM